MNENIIPFKPKLPPKDPQKGRTYPPMINIPPVTKMGLIVMFLIHAIIALISFTLFPPLKNIVLSFGGFVPASFTGHLPFGWWVPPSIITYSVLHAGWVHLLINSVMFAASASGIERIWGAKRLLILFFGSSVIAALTHFAFYSTSAMPIVGASGGISGLFGALIYLMQNMRQDQGLWRIVLIWVGVTVVTGLMGGPQSDMPIAWLAHVGGFLGGIGLAMQLQKKAL